MFGARQAANQRAMLLDRISLRHFHRRPQPVIRAGRGRVGRADDDVAGERIVVHHVGERLVELLLRILPSHQRALGKIRRHQRLPNAANRSGADHRANALHHRLRIDARLLRDHADRIAHEPLNAILGNGKNLRVDGIRVSDGEVSNSGHNVSKIACTRLTIRNPLRSLQRSWTDLRGRLQPG